MIGDPISEYLKEIQKDLTGARATEHTYRPALKTLIESLQKGITATNEPKRVQCGAPDLSVTRGETPVGDIEAKDVGKNLDEIEKSEQMIRYLEGLPNLILTDHLEFRWYENGQYRMSARLARLDSKGRPIREKNGKEALLELVQGFLSSGVPTVGRSKDLAERMAALARLTRDTIRRAFEVEEETEALHSQLKGFQRVLIHNLEPEQFADMYAQTICYGLFAARCNHKSPEPFTRQNAAFELPETNPFLAEMFSYIAGPRLDKRLAWVVDHLVELLSRADIASILEDFGKRTQREDPVVHFYETFLAAYDPKMREARGVYYTPEPVVSFIVESVDAILKKDFGLQDGLADTKKIPLYKKEKLRTGKTRRKKVGEIHKVLILDPAVGTGTFLHGVIDHIYGHLEEKGQAGTWNAYVSKHLLPRLFGFELLMAPYAVAHMKLGLQLAEKGYRFDSGERLRVYLTNTLEEAYEVAELDLFASLIAKEANEASKIKSESPVMVILGNPPYSIASQTKGGWIESNIRNLYYPNDSIREANPKVLLDDYVKFMRFAQWRIESTGYGILAFITNHGYLDNPCFRRMRQSLMDTFDDIYILDLHGNTKKKETAPNGTKDENVFDIQQGVAICIMVKKKSDRTGHDDDQQ